MKIAIMQPYLFPYIGYFKLVNSVNKFVFLDDVKYIKKGWINRNRIILFGKDHYFTIPLSGATQNKLICDLSIYNDYNWKRKLEQSIYHSYSKAKNFKQIYNLISPVLFGENSLIGDMAKQSIKVVADYLIIPTEFINTSKIYNNSSLKGEERILDICLKENSTEYINLKGGHALYSNLNFNKYNLKLTFMNTNFSSYPQFASTFIPSLSIIDVLMHNSQKNIIDMLK